MKDLLAKIKYNLAITEKLVSDFAYTSNLSAVELEEMNIYRAELVSIKIQIEKPATMETKETTAKFSLPSRPSWSDKYL